MAIHDGTATPVRKGQRVRIECPYSEVCMHMQIAGKLMLAELVGETYPAVQLYTLEGKPFSAPITTGEAGFYDDGKGGYYAYVQAEMERCNAA